MLSRDRTLCARCARTVSPRPSATLMSASISSAVEDLQINRVEGGEQRDGPRHAGID